ncbi:MAG TPA: DNA starvation/stationary phase protection protein [Bacilli bacterium]|jgi:starvation-inducible DNA-binding protein|nr:DNA starvation/stationary phase protection protein [Bacilli bacterium]
MKKLHTLLDLQVANFSVLFTKLHHFHWFVDGPQFFALHAKFEELYDHINEVYDAFAERLITIGGRPSSTMKAYLEKATIKEAAGEVSAKEMVLSLIKDMEAIVVSLKELTVAAQEEADEATADLAIGTIGEFEKTLWMLRVTAK